MYVILINDFCRMGKYSLFSFFFCLIECVSFLYPNPPQPKLYRGVIEDVINEVRELFLDEGVDEQVLLELKTVNLLNPLPPSAHNHKHTCSHTDIQSFSRHKAF